MNREGAPGKSPEEVYIQQKVRVLLMLRKMGSNLTASEEEFLRTYAGVVNSQLSQLPQHSIDQEVKLVGTRSSSGFCTAVSPVPDTLWAVNKGIAIWSLLCLRLLLQLQSTLLRPGGGWPKLQC
uniref:Catenin beta interacting protein 1 n=1 Tax=Ovis aries TaxID=9940 RepID=A0AC11E321_SHEEP